VPRVHSKLDELSRESIRLVCLSGCYKLIESWRKGRVGEVMIVTKVMKKTTATIVTAR
jgi:hypothetical protein